MLTEEEKNFLTWWEVNRLRKRNRVWQLAAGLPLAMILVAGIFVNYFSGWYTRATMQINISASGVLVVLIALLLIVVFIVVFSARHRWEMNEQRYQELQQKKNIS